jgi:hypothetical protein
MKLLKIRNGKLEYDNYFMTTPFSDFMGVGNTHRDAEFFYVDTESSIERRIPYENFLIQLKKENWETGNNEDGFIFYIGNIDEQYGIIDILEEEQHEYHKIIFLDKFIQCHVSHDGEVWESLEGLNLEEEEMINIQGFKKTGNNSLKLMEYAVYHDPYLTIQNFPEGYRAELYSTDDVLLKERLFGSNEQTEIYLDKCLTDSYLKIYDNENNLVLSTDKTDFNYGDVYILSDYDLDIIYKERNLPDEEITEMDTFASSQRVTLVNTGQETYEYLTVGTVIDSADKITLSLNNINFSETVVLPIMRPADEIDIYVRIERGEGDGFIVRSFLFKVY